MGQVVLNVNGENFMERDWYAADSTFFDVFDAEFIHGDKSSALTRPASIVLTESAARQYFGTIDVVGRLIEKSNLGVLKVTGVIKDVPANTHLFYNVLVSANYNEKFWQRFIDSWTFDQGPSLVAYTYLVLDNELSAKKLMAALPAFEKLHFGADASHISLELQPLRDIYLHSGEVSEEHRATRSGNLNYIYIFTTMALFLIVIAAINYINLATTRAMSRAREIGVRKVAGAHKPQLVIQYLMESLMLALVAMLSSIAAMDLAFPYFNQITGRDFDIRWDTISGYLPGLLSISVVIGLISGFYPAFYLANLKPVHSLRSKASGPGTHASLRQLLVVAQFSLSILMMIATTVIVRQMNFVQQKDLGFNQDNLMVIDINSGNVRERFRTMKEEYRKIPGVVGVATSSRVPGEWKNIAQVFAHAGNAIDSTNLYFMGFDEDMLDTYRFHMLSGRYFDRTGAGDSTSILINESAAVALGLEDAVGKVISLQTDDGPFKATIIGVVADFNFQSLHQSIAPMAMGAWNNPIQSIDYFTIRFTGDVSKMIAAATAVHEQFDERTPIEYHFLDQQLDSFYDQEMRASMIFKMAACLSIFVACLGLSGLAAYNIQRRVKELGVRKILGASASELFMLLSSSFIKQILVAFAIAAPLAWIIMSRWLDAFQYRVSLGVMMFLLSGLGALAIALTTIGYRILIASRSNPVDALRNNE